MKKLTVSLLATLAVALLSSPSFAANDKDGMSVSENPTLAMTEGSFLIDQYGVAPAFNDRQIKDRKEAIENPFLYEHLSVAPAWDDRQIKDNPLKAQGERMENPSLIGIFDNVE
jgi:hypothetical protein